MTWVMKYTLTAIPPVLFFALWKLAAFFYGHFNCQGDLKSLAPCSAGGFDLQLFLGIGLFWGQLIFWLSLPVSAYFLISVGAKHVGSKQTAQR